MIRIRADQMADIENAAFRRRKQQLRDELEPQHGDRAAHIIEQAEQDAVLFDLVDPVSFERYVKMALGLTDEALESRWAPMVAWVLSNGAHTAADRLDFVERYLLPRIFERGD